MLSSPGGGVPPDGRVVQVQYEESQLLMVEHRRSAVGYGLSMVELIASGCASSSCSCKVCFFFWDFAPAWLSAAYLGRKV